MKINFSLTFIFSVFLLTLNLIKFINSTLQIKLDDNRERCFIEELFSTSIISLKWKIELGSMINLNKNTTKLQISEMIPASVLQNIHIYIKEEETNIIVTTFTAEFNKHKNSFQSKKHGSYFICIQYKGRLLENDSIYYSMKIHSDNMEEPKLNEAVKKTDIDPLQNIAHNIVTKSKEIVMKQESELSDEDHYAILEMSITTNYKMMNFIQVMVILGLGLYQVYSFRKFLLANNLI